jgi:predicted alpha/beta hydrolase
LVETFERMRSRSSITVFALTGGVAADVMLMWCGCCQSPMLGEDSDVVMREWEYWPFDAGFDRGERPMTWLTC